jgi:hypothetical protein
MITVPALLLVLLSTSGGNLARRAEIEAVGPVKELVLSLGSAGETRLLGELLPGERTPISVPLPARDAAPRIVPEIRWSGGEGLDQGSEGRGRVRFLGWSEDLAAKAIDALPPGLRARSRPPLSPPEVLLPRASLALLPACLVVGLALRRRASLSVLFAAVASGALLGLGRPREGPAEREVIVLESDAQSPSGLAIAATWESAQLSADDLRDAVVETSKEEARLVWTGSLSGTGSWSAFARNSAIYVELAVEARAEDFRRERNGGRDLAEAWVREDGVWTARGPWPLGAPLPPSRPGPPPPGWIVSGLPQGISVLVGRASTPERSRSATWVRETGF